MCMMDGDGYSEFHDERYLRARKPHKCGECSRTIQPGESYRRHAGKYDGDFFSGKTCSHCAVAQDVLVHYCRGFIYGGVSEDISEHAYPGLPWGMDAARLKVGMRRQWHSFRGTGLMRVPKITLKPREQVYH